MALLTLRYGTEVFKKVDTSVKCLLTSAEAEDLTKWPKVYLWHKLCLLHICIRCHNWKYKKCRVWIITLCFLIPPYPNNSSCKQPFNLISQQALSSIFSDSNIVFSALNAARRICKMLEQKYNFRPYSHLFSGAITGYKLKIHLCLYHLDYWKEKLACLKL